MKRLIRRLRKVNRLMAQAIEDGYADKVMQSHYLQKRITAQIILLINLAEINSKRYDFLI